MSFRASAVAKSSSESNGNSSIVRANRVDNGEPHLLGFDAHRVTPADAIHLASAAAAGVDLFLTNDRALQPLLIPGIHFIAGLGVNLF